MLVLVLMLVTVIMSMVRIIVLMLILTGVVMCCIVTLLASYAPAYSWRPAGKAQHAASVKGAKAG